VLAWAYAGASEGGALAERAIDSDTTGGLDLHRRRLILPAAAIASCAIFAADALSPIDGAVAVL